VVTQQDETIRKEIGITAGAEAGAGFNWFGLRFKLFARLQSMIRGSHEKRIEISQTLQGYSTDLVSKVNLLLGDARAAIPVFEETMAIAREIGDRRGEGNALGNLGSAHARLGDARKAIQHYEHALVIEREIGHGPGQCTSLGNLGIQWRRLGETDKARACLDEGLQIALLARDLPQTVQLAWQLASLYSDCGDVTTGVALEAFAFSRFRAMGYPRAEAAGRSLARHCREMGEAKFRDALARAEETVAAIFRDLAGEAAAEMAAGIIQAFTADPFAAARGPRMAVAALARNRVGLSIGWGPRLPAIPSLPAGRRLPKSPRLRKSGLRLVRATPPRAFQAGRCPIPTKPGRMGDRCPTKVACDSECLRSRSVRTYG